MLAGIAEGDPAVARDIRRRVMNTLCCVGSFVAFAEAVERADAPAGRLVVAFGGPRDSRLTIYLAESSKRVPAIAAVNAIGFQYSR
jgi:hypothetical protein